MEVGYTCSFQYYWEVSLERVVMSKVDHIVNIFSNRADTVFSARPSLLAVLGRAFEKAKQCIVNENPPLAARLKDKPNIHITLAGEGRSRGPYVVVMLKELVSTLETSHETEAEFRHRDIRDRSHMRRLKERYE